MTESSSVIRVDRIGAVHTDPTRTDGVLATLTNEGFLQCDALITRTGVFDYEDSEGNTWGEFRDADEVFDEASLESFQMVVMTDDHPEQMVNVDNVKDVQVGHVGSDVRREGEFVRVSLTITDADVIRSIQDGKVELSCGYFAQVVQDSGVAPDGTPFTSRQTKIRGNHLALVDQGRAGASCRLQLDSGGAITKQDVLMKKKPKEEKKDATVIVGGEEFDVPDEVAASLAEMAEKISEQAAALAKLEAAPAADEEIVAVEADADEIEAAKEEAPKPAPAAAPAAEDASDEEENKAMNDAMQATIDSLKASNAKLEAKFDAAQAARTGHIDARVKLVTTCQKLLGDEFTTDGVPDLDLKKAVIVHALPDMKGKLDGKSADYLQCAFEMALKEESNRVDSGEELLEVAGQAIVDGAEGEDDIDSCHTDMVKNFEKSYRRPSAQEIN